MLAQQVGIPVDTIAGVLPLWNTNLVNIEKPKAIEAIKVLLLNGGPAGKDAGKWIAALVRYCGGVQQTGNNETTRKEPEGCHKCRYSGCIEVPSIKDYHNGEWRGMYTQVVACDCPAGQWRACQLMNMRQYEAMHPDWESQYPVKKHERLLRDMQKREPAKDKDDRAKEKSLVAWLKEEVNRKHTEAHQCIEANTKQSVFVTLTDTLPASGNYPDGTS